MGVGNSVCEGSTNSHSRVECDALLIDPTYRTDTYPYIEIEEKRAKVVLDDQP